MIKEQFGKISLAELKFLVENDVMEKKTLEYKSQPPGNKRSSKINNKIYGSKDLTIKTS